LKKGKTSVRWTAREDALICRLRKKGCDPDEITTHLPHRTPIAVRRRCAHLLSVGRFESLRPSWTPQQDALLCKLHAKEMPLSEMVRRFKGRTEASLAQRAYQLRLNGRAVGDRARPHRAWTAREDQILIRMRARGATIDQMAAKLTERTRSAVIARLRALIESAELERAPHSRQSHRPWSREEDELVLAMRRAGKSIPDMAAALDRSHASVNGRVAQRVRKGELPLVRSLK
jgi:hypothetical protein